MKIYCEKRYWILIHLKALYKLFFFAMAKTLFMGWPGAKRLKCELDKKIFYCGYYFVVNYALLNIGYLLFSY